MAKRNARQTSKPLSSVRIIAGHWRRRRIAVPLHPDLRPTGDRVRETLFNWISPYIAGANCLDLFAGSGVLALEAISRGAVAATLVEKDQEIVRHLRDTAGQFNHPGISIKHSDALNWLADGEPRVYDIIFLDPPFSEDLIPPVLNRLVDGWLSSQTLIYIESGSKLKDIPLPDELQWTKHAQLGNVSIGLVKLRVPT